MNNVIPVFNKNINVRFNLHAIKIYNDAELTALLQHNLHVSTNELIILIKKQYVELFRTDFKVSDASMAIEIWAHVYMQKWAIRIQQRFLFRPIQWFCRKVIYHCMEIDIGERGHDDNRFVWNWLSVFKTPVDWFLK